ncbi:hypothetical protein ACGC1H_005699 [Rhizoctonia solani]
MPRALDFKARYGPDLDEYLRSKMFENNHREPPCREDIRQAIQSLLYDPEKVLCETLATILALENMPVKDLELLKLEPMPERRRTGLNRGALGACLDLMRAYCEDGKRAVSYILPRNIGVLIALKILQLLDHAFGFLCLRVMSLFILYGTLDQTAQLDTILGLVANSTPRGHSIFRALGKYTWHVVRGLVESNANDACDEWWIIRWYQDAMTGGARSLLTVGCCTPDDAILLLELLWTARSQLLYAARWATEIFPGMCGLFLLIGSSLNQRYGDPEYKQTRDGNTLWMQFIDLAIRYTMCSGEHENQILPFLVLMCPQVTKQSTLRFLSRNAVDTFDSAQIEMNASKRLRSTMEFPLNFGTVLFAFACANLDSEGFDDILVDLLRADFERLWFIINGPAEMSVQACAELTRNCQQILLSILKVASVNPYKVTTIIDAVGEDLTELYGRLILWLYSNSRGQAMEASLDEHEKYLKGFIETIYEVVSQFTRHPGVNSTEKVFPIWQKVNYCLVLREFEFLSLGYGQSEVEHVTRWGRIWFNFWGIFHVNEDYLGLGMHCTYPRCPDAVGTRQPLRNCAKCGVVNYCSTRCQQADWNYSNQPHHILCGHVR